MCVCVWGGGIDLLIDSHIAQVRSYAAHQAAKAGECAPHIYIVLSM